MPTAKAYSLLVAIIVLLAACSDPPPPQKLADISSSQQGGAVYLYVPGSIRDDYMTLEVGPENERASLIALTQCSSIAARFVGGVLELVLFEADFHVQSPRRPQKTAVMFELQIKTFNRAPNEGDVNTLKQDGFSIVKCDFPK